MKKLISLLIASCLALSACGYTAVDSEMIGQVKMVKSKTPIVCPDFKEADISLGVLRGGVGSMSTQDVWVVITSDAQLAVFKRAAETGELVKVTFDKKRVTFCTGDIFAKSVEIVK